MEESLPRYPEPTVGDNMRDYVHHKLWATGKLLTTAQGLSTQQANSIITGTYFILSLRRRGSKLLLSSKR